MNGWNAPHLSMVLVGLAGIVVWHVIPQRRSTTRLVVQIAFFLTMSALLLDGSVTPFEPAWGKGSTASAILVASAKVLWWVHLAWALIGFVRIYLVFEHKPRQARLLQDIVVGVVYVGMILSILAFVFGAPVGTLVATSGVFAIILGLALQNTLSDVFSGIALNLGRPYVLGDWIVLGDGSEGRVIETNWRSTHLLTAAHNVVAVPNSLLAKAGVTNVSRPEESHVLTVTIRLALTRMPAVIADVMNAALASSNIILQEPLPVVAIRGLDATAVEVELAFRVAKVGQRTAARNEIFDLVYRHAKSAGLRLAAPPTSAMPTQEPPADDTTGQAQVTPRGLINAIPLFAELTDDEKETLAATVTLRTYRKGDVIVREGGTLPCLMIVRAGIIVRERGDESHDAQVVGHLAPGDFFGETGLLAGIGETSTLRAMNHVVVYEIDQPSFAPLLLDRPEMAEDLATILAARMSPPDGSDGASQQHADAKSALLNAMRTAFRAAPLRRVLSNGKHGAQG